MPLGCIVQASNGMDESHRNVFRDPLIREHSSEAFCRLCFSQIHELHRVFPTNDQPNKLLVRKIEYCTNVTIAIGKDSTACVCTKCIALVEEFFRFKQLCHSNEQWLKQDECENHVDSDGRLSLIPSCISPTPLQESSSNSCSLITIGSEDGHQNYDHEQYNYAEDEPLIKLEDSIEQIRFENYSNEVTSSGNYMRARRPTTRIIQNVPGKSMTKIPLKPEESDYDEETSAYEIISDCGTFSPAIEHIEKSDADAGTGGFSLVRGSKTRSNRLYLVYKAFRYSNPSNDGKIWRCTHRAPVYCRAMVMLEKNQVIELNNHHHNHPPPNIGRKKTNKTETAISNKKENVKISLVLKKEKEPRRRPSNRKNSEATKQSESNKWFIKANRKTVDGFTYTFCGLRKDGIIRMKCISKGCTGRIYMYSNGELFKTNKQHNHPSHVPV